MTRDGLINECGLRLGDNSAAFQAVLGPFFDDIMREMAVEALLPALIVTNTFSTVEDQENYSTLTMTGLTVPPVKIMRIRVPTWGTGGIIEPAENDEHYELYRQAFSDLRGRFLLWRIYPNISQVQFWPPVDSSNVGTNIGEIQFAKSPTVITGPTTITECPNDDLGTLKWGIIMLGAPFRDDTLIDVDKAREHYLAGKQAMRARLWTQTPVRAEPRDF